MNLFELITLVLAAILLFVIGRYLFAWAGWWGIALLGFGLAVGVRFLRNLTERENERSK